MKICILAPRFPFPENGGDVLRINNIARYLKSQNHQVILVSFILKSEEENKQKYDTSLYDKVYFVRRHKFISIFNTIIALFSSRPLQCAYFYSNFFLKVFKKVVKLENPDIYITHTHRVVRYIQKLRLESKTIIEMTDALSKTYSLSQNTDFKSYKSLIYKIEKNRIEKYERFLIDNFKKIVLVSESDKEYLNSPSNVYVYPNGNSLKTKSIAEYDSKKIVFLGNMRSLQNQDAVIFFTKEIFPKLLTYDNSLKFYIIGAQPSEKILRLNNDDNIFVTGFVDDIGEYLKDACFSIAPIRIAAGIQNKVLESMSYHIPVILSDLISQGIPELISGQNCFIAKNIDEYIKYSLILINNQSERNRVANEGFDVIKKFYSWNSKLFGYEDFN